MEKAMFPSGYMGTKEASKIWGVSQNTISRWCREKRIPAEHDAPGSPWRIPVDATPPFTANKKK